MVALGADPLVFQRRTGHYSVRTGMDIYGHILTEVDERVAAGLAPSWGPVSWGPGPRVKSASLASI
jgi:hypothetical protein